MNIFRFCGDMLHVASIMLLLYKLHKNKSCVGVSCRTQEIYALVFMLRYLDLMWSFVSVYNTVMKSSFIISTVYLIYIMRHQPPVATTYDREKDTFRYELWLLPPAAVLGVLTSSDWTIPEILWTISIWLESVAIYPQLALLQQVREVENLTSNFVGAMGAYRAFYILNWIYRYTEDGTYNWVGWCGGTVQTLLYVDFFYYYLKSKMSGNKLLLPETPV
uniref:ER lumen protein-retaining receptor n=1 Tax=Alexandrium catenella TaxID=2925 RepID=A0A7S1WCB9_ALECA|mmetsp:Transcript_48580/g.130008  ORF Transcript_48580/g.130008 Transcript_48580/m.130008 type:complete len:219 (+) Transcript_48580:89-745(+)|eukprot:CAMPEP_0171216772 /NCGR_PEP_ID=MMETSP0790-20130122/32349_1 /TAXON_ID=2925 /ORGANISM="Alexandrium catenella, Strain OF101" /LENGTH=218 /DNA_ID=CAMNT_0011682555 /DNA_START=86 /DNA_END=742 /DNA_ORIENTATION=+